MTPIKQTKVTGEGVKGNCLAASIASILDISISDVPEFEEMAKSKWKKNLACWLQSIGYSANFSRNASNGFCIAVGRHLDGILHAVIVNAGQFYFDPNPSNEFFHEICYYIDIKKAFYG